MRSYLHSTMLLLYRLWDSLKRPQKTIYIPLCFYFIALRQKNRPYFVNLHSTMPLLYPCDTDITKRKIIHLHSTMLLLYLASLLQHQHLVQFTFHYASTLSVIASVMFIIYHTFTFHYASTLSHLL